MTFRLMTAAMVVAGLSAAAWAHSGATGVVKQRMDAMKEMDEAIKRIKPMMTGDVAYDTAAVRQAARMIAGQSGAALTDLFPEGSIQPPSEARPDIWSDWARFETLARQLGEAARGLDLAAGNGRHGAGHMMTDDLDGMMGSGMMSGGMMGSGMMAGAMSAEHIGQMPADGAFVMMTQVCAACHDRYRAED